MYVCMYVCIQYMTGLTPKPIREVHRQHIRRFSPPLSLSLSLSLFLSLSLSRSLTLSRSFSLSVPDTARARLAEYKFHGPLSTFSSL
jgi:hypothetical protein